MLRQYYKYPLASYVRGHSLLRGEPSVPAEIMEKELFSLGDGEILSLFELGRASDLKLYRFKNTHDNLPRVKRVMGFLKSIYFDSLLDVGSGRGVFLFPFISSFPYINVTTMDILDYRAEFLSEVATGGVKNLTSVLGNICDAPFDGGSFDVVTLLEVLEHIPNVADAVKNAVRLARKFVVVSVPSHADDNPEHIHLLTKDRLTELFNAAGCKRLSFSGVTGHLILIANVE